MQSDEAQVIVLGDDLVGVNLGDTRTSQALADYLRATGYWIECVAGIESCVARFDVAGVDLATARNRLSEALQAAPPAAELEEGLVEIPVCYGGTYGPDMGDICEQLDLSRDEIVALHSGREYRVDMLGFTPGFAFVGGLDDALNVPRRREPRVRLEAGSIGIAGGRTGIYTLAGPGGWPVIGRTPMQLFDAHADDPFGLRAGMRVKFVPIDPAEFARAASE